MNFFESVAYRILPRLFRPYSPFSSHIGSLHQDIPQWDKQNHLWGIYSSSRQSCPCKQYLHRILDLCLRIDHCRTENHFWSCTRILKKMTTVSIVRAATRGNNSTTTHYFVYFNHSCFHISADFTSPDSWTYQDGFNNPIYGQSEDY